MKLPVLKRKSAGYSLVELMVAIGVLAITTAPIIMLYTYSTRMAAAAHRQTIAAVLAQQRIENLIGLSRAELDLQYTTPALKVQKESGLEVELVGNGFKSAYGDIASQANFLNELAEVTVRVIYDNPTKPLVEQTVIISLAE